MASNFRYPIVVVGNASVGKTSIIMRYCKQVFEKTYLPTLCSDLCTKTVVTADGHVADLQIWDIGGQDQYKLDRDHYLKRAYVIIVVFDVSDVLSYMSLGDWMDDIRDHAPRDVMTIVVANKIDLREMIEHCISREQFEHEARSIGFDAAIETSALADTNVSTLFDIAVKLCSGKRSFVPEPFTCSSIAAARTRK